MRTSSHRVLSVVIPAYNEERSLASVVERVLLLPNLLEIVIVDDASRDGTPGICETLARTYPQVKWTRLARNSGKTEAVKTGFAMTAGEIVIVQDADLEYDPAEIPEVISPILEDQADVVFGSRFLVRRAARVVYFYHYVANKLITFTSNVFTNLNMTDVETGYKAFRGEIIRNMIITSDRFGFEVEVAAKVAKLKCRVYEVPISYYGRTYEEGKKIGPLDGVWAMWFMLKYNLFTGLKASYREVPQLGAFRQQANASAQS